MSIRNKLVITVFLSSALFANVSSATSWLTFVANNLDQVLTTTNSQQSAALPEEHWTAEYSHNLVLIPSDGLIIPVEIEKPTITLSSERGTFKFSEDEVRAVTRTPVVTYSHDPGVSMDYRPTLYVTLCGFRPDDYTFDGDGDCNWQWTIQNELESLMIDHQYKHFLVDWDTHATNRTQVQDLADVIKRFLNDRINIWDVVLVGHSRGGIFAHDLTREIVGHSKINNLHTFLLDPTANGAPLNDFYPVYKHKASPTTHFASLYYDGEQFLIGTIGDRNISGYNNYDRNNFLFNSTHVRFPFDWIPAPSGFQQALVDIKSRKQIGSYPIDGESGVEYVRITRPDGVNFEGEITFDGDNVRVWGEISIGGVPGASISVDAEVGADGLAVASANGIAASQIIINEDMLYVSNSTPVANYTASVSSDGVSANVSVVVLNAGASIDSDEIYIGINIGGTNVGGSVDTGDALCPACGSLGISF